MATNVQQVAVSKPGASSGSQGNASEYVVRVPNDPLKKYSMIKFASGTDIDFLKLSHGKVKMERENNLRQYKTIYNLDAMPKFGAGSEYGREQKEEARRKKYGINIKKYNPNDQPWLMKVGDGKDCKRYKGVREGTISENTSYYIFTKCADGAFEAFPIEEWYNFQPVVKYKYLNSEEAEEEFSRRDKTMNLFSIMVRKRIKNEEETEEKPEDKKDKKKDKKSLILTDMEDWMETEDEEEEEEEAEEGAEKKPKKEKKEEKTKRRKNAKINADDEAVEESDEGDFDDRELDYISDSGSESSLDEKAKNDKYDDQGVDQEKGLKKLIDSEEESSEEENKEEDEEDEEEEAEKEAQSKKEKKKKKDSKENNKEGGESDSSSSSSDSDDSDIDKNEDKFSSVLFMQEKKRSSRPNTPTVEKLEIKTEPKSEGGIKRKIEAEEGGAEKKVRTESPAPSLKTSASSSSISSSGEITEEAIRHYLTRRPMTAKELVQKFKAKKSQMSNEQLTQKIGQLLKKINPGRKYIKGVMYLSLEKTE
ncbi:general transcription factor IIF subunit 1-like isoform X2 [Dreissena polymorpha]|uniref:general transcription factor IIF subunit 1-like isoform X2 n=1 Tax=Dreissena polymorpha TaxID=45954 RepID=UPI002264E7A9|nr:general transcription factor IIF subunit 1-like isoform X2 [Dreissena polymorpha]